jgi:hypothetical protein
VKNEFLSLTGSVLLTIDSWVGLLMFYLVYRSGFDCLIREPFHKIQALTRNWNWQTRFSAGLVLLVLTAIVFYAPGRFLSERFSDNPRYGQPISNELVSFKNKIFRPRAVITVDGKTVLYNEDGKFYSLDGLILGQKPDELFKPGASYTVYSQSNQLWFARLN